MPPHVEPAVLVVAVALVVIGVVGLFLVVAILADTIYAAIRSKQEAQYVKQKQREHTVVYPPEAGGGWD